MDHSRSKFSKLGNALRSWPAGIAALVLLLLVVAYKLFGGGTLSGGAASSEFLELSGSRIPHYTMLTSSFVHSVWPLTLLAFFLAVTAVRLSTAIARSRKQSLLVSTDDESGSSAVELVLVLPPLAVLLLLILQIALIVQAKFVVNYAAFCAARSAIVVIPEDVSSSRPPEPSNHLGNPDKSEKVEVIHRAAALPLTAVSPLPGSIFVRGVPFLPDADTIFGLVKLAPFDVTPRSMMVEAMARAPYAYHPENTVVKVLTSEGNEEGDFKDHDWVTVKVQYRYYLTVPFAKKFFGTSYSGNQFLTMLFGSEYYYPIVEQYTLPVDGEPMLP